MGRAANLHSLLAMDISFLENGVAYEVAGEGPLVVCSPGMGDRRDAFQTKR